MTRNWYILAVIILIYLPVTIDATVLHVAVPSISLALNVTSNEMLWIIDIYSLVMAGMILPMGALGDRIGYKQLTIIGSLIFGTASLLAAFSSSAIMLIISRGILAMGAAMIIPATLAGIRNSFPDEKQRNIALGIWATIGSGGAAMGPLVGGFLLEHFFWGSVFLINIPIILLVIVFTCWFIPTQKKQPNQTLNLLHSSMLIVSVLLLVYAAKSGIKESSQSVSILLFTLCGIFLLVMFIRSQLKAPSPMIDMQLFIHPTILVGIIMAITAMIALVGFELLISQELQFVHAYSPLEAGIFMLPVMISSGFSGPAAGWLVSRYGLRKVATAGMALSSVSFLGLATTDFSHQTYIAWSWMILLGFSIATALLASTSAIMAAAPKEKAAAAGAIEGMAYELGAGIGVAIFGLMLLHTYRAAIILPPDLSAETLLQVRASISEATQATATLNTALQEKVTAAANTAFMHAHSVVLITASIILLILTSIIWLTFSPAKKSITKSVK